MKKWLLLAMALLMMLMPVLSQAQEASVFDVRNDLVDDAVASGRRAETRITVSDVMATGNKQIDRMLRDVSELLEIFLYEQGDEGGLALRLGEEDVLTLAGAVSGEDMYISTNLLGETLVIAPAEIQLLCERLIDLGASMGLIGEEDAAQIKSMVPQMLAEIAAQLEEAGRTFDAQEVNWSALADAGAILTESIQVDEVTGQARNFDLASTRVTIVLTPEQMQSLMHCGVAFLRDNEAIAEAFREYMVSNGGYVNYTMNGEDVTYLELLDGIDQKIDTDNPFRSDTTITVYLNDAQEIVAANVILPREAHTTIDYTRLTLNDAVTHAIVVQSGRTTTSISILSSADRFLLTAAVEDGMTLVNASFSYTAALTDAGYDMSGELIVEAFENDQAVFDARLPFTQTARPNGLDVNDTFRMTLLLDGTTVGTLNVVTATGEPQPSIMEGSVLRPTELTDEDFEDWVMDVIGSLQDWLNHAVQSLPVSVLQLLMPR